jgi:predicted TPR repeat methyltransferase
MPNSTIGQAYDQLAERWLDNRFSRTDGVRQHRQALAFLDSKREGWALNAGCGCNTRFNSMLREHGLQLEAIDVSERMVGLARAADASVVLHHADICEWQPPRRYRFISAWDSIWHVCLEQQHPLMLKLMGALEPGGVFLFTAGGLDEPNEHVDNAMGPPVRYATLGTTGLLDAIKEAGCLCRHLEFDQHPQTHLFVVAQRAA